MEQDTEKDTNTDSVKDSIKRLAELKKGHIQRKIEDSADKSLKVLNDLVDSEDVPPVVRMNAAKDILDRAGFKPVERQVVAHVLPTPILGGITTSSTKINLPGEDDGEESD